MLEGINVLIVYDEEDFMTTLEDLLPMRSTVQAGNYETAEELLKSTHSDMVILEIMGVSGYKLLEICFNKEIVAVMLTAHEVTPANIHKSFGQEATHCIPKNRV